MSMNCPTCHAPLDRSDRLVIGCVVLRCRQCRQFRVEGDNMVFEAGTELLKNLTRRAIDLLQAKVDQEVLTSDIDDPRWERVL